MFFEKCVGKFANFLQKYGGFPTNMLYFVDKEKLETYRMITSTIERGYLRLVLSSKTYILSQSSKSYIVSQFCVRLGGHYIYLDIPRELFNKSDDMFRYICETYGGGWIWKNNSTHGKLWIPDLLECEIMNSL